ncbi:LacI family DNA-binding transcriptional regulator [Neomoorella thermoacetica]|uniref:LacI family DNA-binding transcriptional regulator n=1 Tax=Neomoorella thermoacetica TaxID=1525 RepID=UPI0008FB9D02|nr:LacI family DNA-binding transcriptional regulator [Moorella thermoacetica]APC09003.1 catabolite control protein A [Moorella thermoacetica]OIQ55049.1 catabolite control protein A [Moorella thermoacetica]
MVNIKEVAERAGVSPSTVSRALSGRVAVSPETKEKVMRAVRELNYQPNALAKGLKEGRSKTIGLIIPNVRNLVFPAAIKGITDVAKKYGYTVILCNTDEDLETEKAYVDNLRKRLVDGLIFSTATAASTHILELKEKGFPVVLLIRHLKDKVDAVIVDNYQGGYEATRFLIQRGYRRIAFVNGTLDLDLYRQRFAGYQAALAEAGIAYHEELVVHGTRDWEDGYRAILTILERGQKPDAVFAASDPKALGVIKALKEKGLRVPEDVAVMGYDNLDMSELMDPPLTTMAQPFYEVGKRAAERLIKLINSKRKSRPVVEKLPAQLLVRASVDYGPGGDHQGGQ